MLLLFMELLSIEFLLDFCGSFCGFILSILIYSGCSKSYDDLCCFEFSNSDDRDSPLCCCCCCCWGSILLEDLDLRDSLLEFLDREVCDLDRLRCRVSGGAASKVKKKCVGEVCVCVCA